jgi:hypothetical protein
MEQGEGNNPFVCAKTTNASGTATIWREFVRLTFDLVVLRDMDTLDTSHLSLDIPVWHDTMRLVPKRDRRMIGEADTRARVLGNE